MAVDIFQFSPVELYVLMFLREEDAHGYQLVQNLEKFSDGFLTVKTASLYPILYKLEKNGCISSYELFVESTKARAGRKSGRMRVVYHIEEPGYARLEELLKVNEEFAKGSDILIAKLKGEVHND